jgi:hypothetical protein
VVEACALTLKRTASPAIMMDLCVMVLVLSFDLMHSFVLEGKRPFFTSQGAKRRGKDDREKRQISRKFG